MSWIIFAAIGVIFASTREIWDKKVLNNEEPFDFLVLRGIFFTFFSLFLIPWASFEITAVGLGLILLGAVLVTIAIYHKRTALKNMDISMAEPLMNFTPLFTAFIAFIFLGETLSWLELSGVLLIVIGTYVLETDHTHKGILGPIKKLWDSKYAIMMIIAAKVFSIQNVVSRAAVSRHLDIFTYFILMWLTAHIILAAIHFTKYRFKDLGKTLKRDKKGIALCAFLDVGSTMFLYQSFSLAPAALVISIYRLQSLFATMFGGKFFHEDHVGKHAASCLVMIIGAALVIL